MRRVAVAVLALLVPILALGQGKSLVETPDPQTSVKAYAHVHALLIGINKYPNLPPTLQLSHAVNDAESLRNVLAGAYGFGDVTVLADGQATLESIRAALSRFADNTKVHEDDLVLVYFSGHGQTVPLANGGAMGFLIPTDAKVDLSNPTNSAPYLATCLPMKQVWDYLDLSPAKHALVIADACFSGLMARSRGIGVSNEALSVMLARRARQVVTAGTAGQRTTERDDLGHGVFTAKLLEELQARAKAGSSAFTLTELFGAIQTQVSNSTSGKQVPQMGNFDSEGEVVLVPVPIANSTPKRETEQTKKTERGPEPGKFQPKTSEPAKGQPAASKPRPGMNKRQASLFDALSEILRDGVNKFSNLPTRGNAKVSKPSGNVDVLLSELAKPLPGYSFGGVSSEFVYFSGTPSDYVRLYEDSRAAARAVLQSGREQTFDETHWRISDGNYTIEIRRDKEDAWGHQADIHLGVVLTIAKVK